MNYIVDMLPETFKSSWCIAGGFAACPALAADIDLWVFDRTNLEEARATILEHLAQRILEVKLHHRRPYQVVEEEAQEQHQASERYCNLFVNISKVCVVYGRREYRDTKPVHIMVTDAPDPGSLISAFDVSTHAVAIDHNSRVYKHELYTHPGEAPILIRCNEKTEPRYKKICERFGQPQVLHDFTPAAPRPNVMEQLNDDDIPF